MTSREVILRRVADGLRNVPRSERPEDVVVPRDYQRTLGVAVVDRFVERISEYRTTVCRVAARDVAGAIAEQLASRGLTRLAAAPDLPEAWRPREHQFVTEGLDALALDRVDGAV